MGLIAFASTRLEVRVKPGVKPSKSTDQLIETIGKTTLNLGIAFDAKYCEFDLANIASNFNVSSFSEKGLQTFVSFLRNRVNPSKLKVDLMYSIRSLTEVPVSVRVVAIEMIVSPAGEESFNWFALK
jgi:hypothetical protein